MEKENTFQWKLQDFYSELSFYITDQTIQYNKISEKIYLPNRFTPNNNNKMMDLTMQI